MSDFRKKVIQDHISLFEGLPFQVAYQTKESIHYFINLTDEIRWNFGISVSYIGKKWYIHYFNNLMNDRSSIYRELWSNKFHHKNNWLLTCKKNNYSTIFKELCRFQTQIIWDIVPSVWEDNGYVYYTHKGINTLIWEGAVSDNAIELMNEQLKIDLSISLEKIEIEENTIQMFFSNVDECGIIL